MQEEDAARQVLALDLIEKGEATENQLTREGVHQALQSEDELFHLLFRTNRCPARASGEGRLST